MTFDLDHMIAERFAWLQRRAEAGYSQFGEQGILKAIFDRVGTMNRWAFECGAFDGLALSNVRWCMDAGWDVILVERDPLLVAKMVENTWQFRQTICRCRELDGSYSVDDVIKECRAPLDLDLVVIDVDGPDYWVMEDLTSRPRVLMVEFRHGVDSMDIPAREDAGVVNQTGLLPILELACDMRYVPVAQTYCNLIMVEHQLEERLCKS
jgi:hypothetical protein